MSAATAVGRLSGRTTTAEASDIALLVEREAPALLAYFGRRVREREDAADLLGELLTVVWRRRSAIPPDPTAARMWMYGVARKTLARHRRGSVRRAALADRLREELTTRPSIEASDDAARRVRELISKLPETDREIIGLSYWEGFSLVEVARILGMPPATVRSRHARAKARLRGALLAEDEIPRGT